MNDSEQFALSFNYYFKHFYAQAFPRDRMLHNLGNSIDALYRRAKQLKSAKNQNRHFFMGGLPDPHGDKQQRFNTGSTAASSYTRQLLASTYDEVSNYSEELPPINESELENSKLNGFPVKIVNIVKGSEPLGATIKAYPNGEIYVARVIVGGAADRCGSIQPGDQILEVNNIPVSFKSPNEIINIVQNGNSDGVVSFKLVANKMLMSGSTSSRYNKMKRQKYVRAHFDYLGSEDTLQPCKQAALSFQNGDVLEILANDDPYWLQARCIGHGTLITAPLDQDDEITITDMSLVGDKTDFSQQLLVGIIPTELVLFKQKFSNSIYNTLPELCYEPVSMLQPGENRPVILIGAPGVGRNELKKRLIAYNPIKFAAPVPHTRQVYLDFFHQSYKSGVIE